MKKVFLGGTCNESTWRDELIQILKIDYFDPVVDDWNERAQREEIKQREICDFVLYTITPKMTGVYAIAEVVDDSNKRPDKTVFCYLEKDGDNIFSIGQLRSLNAVAHMIKVNGGHVCTSLNECASILNGDCFANK
jgi:hypothetical protein